MRSAICFTAVLFAMPALATDAPPRPPPVTYNVWGFSWDGGQYAKQTTHSFATSDIQKAADYAAQITSYAGWSATTNLPEACVAHTVFRGPMFTSARPSSFPDKPTYTVWAFKLTDGKWVEDEKYSWMTTDPLLGLDYAKKVNAASGWSATDNCPKPVPKEQRFIDGGTVHGAETYSNYRFTTCDTPYGPRPREWTRYRLSAATDAGRNANRDVQFNGMDTTLAYDNSIDIQNMINTQNVINNIQDMVNMQNMIDTQNMVNSLQANP